ncbi:MAG: cysteine desulfurase [Streptococcaceae bacterium]|nr:cysteine desulfurase [Streptococcaceae bacterium]MCL2681235.1 cysteine desulfurase [Streptococcaceae bacterium]
MIYLDNAATTPLLPEVIEAMTQTLNTVYGNPSSVHTLGRKASQVLRESRESLAHLLEANPRQITFTSGGSESNSTAIIGYALAHQDMGKHLIATSIEHPSVLKALSYLKNRHGFDITLVSPHSDGSYTSELIKESLRSDTLLVSMMAANNETGQLLPIAEVGRLLENHQAIFHVDAVQVMGKIPFSPKEFKIDLFSATGHKFHGPKGVGFLYHKENILFDPLIHGGEQEEKHRAGTENLASIVGMTKALEIAYDKMAKNYDHIEKLNQRLLDNLTGTDIYINQFGQSLPHILNLGISNTNHDLLLTQFDLSNIAISTGSACTAGTVEPSHVLEAVYGTDSPKLRENIRVSFSELNTSQEVDTFTNQLKKIL